MKIISKYKDFYDYLAQDYDADIVYDRKPKFISERILNKFMDRGSKFSDPVYYPWNKNVYNIQISYILLLISSIGLVVCLVLDNKKKLSIFIITGIILSPIAIKASTIGFNIFLKTELGLYDKMVVTYEVDGENLSITYKGNTVPFKTTFKIDSKKLIIKDSFGSDVEYIRK